MLCLAQCHCRAVLSSSFMQRSFVDEAVACSNSRGPRVASFLPTPTCLGTAVTAPASSSDVSLSTERCLCRAQVQPCLSLSFPFCREGAVPPAQEVVGTKWSGE